MNEKIHKQEDCVNSPGSAVLHMHLPEADEISDSEDMNCCAPVTLTFDLTVNSNFRRRFLKIFKKNEQRNS